MHTCRLVKNSSQIETYYLYVLYEKRNPAHKVLQVVTTVYIRKFIANEIRDLSRE